MAETSASAFRPPVTVALTGASGAQYGLRLIDCRLAAGPEVWGMSSMAAQMVIATETDERLPAQPAPRVFSGRRFSTAGGFLRERGALPEVFLRGLLLMRPAGRGPGPHCR